MSQSPAISITVRCTAPVMTKKAPVDQLRRLGLLPDQLRLAGDHDPRSAAPRPGADAHQQLPDHLDAGGVPVRTGLLLGLLAGAGPLPAAGALPRARALAVRPAGLPVPAHR